MSTITPRQAGWQQGWILVLAGFLPIMAIIALAPALPTLLAHFKDVANPQLMVPLLLTAPSACIALLAPVAGIVTDRFGRRPLMLASMVLYGAGGLVPFFFDSFWAVVGGRVLIGIAEAGILTVANTLLADYYEDDETRHRWLAIQGLAGSVMGSGLLALSGFLASLGWQWPFLVYAVAAPVFVASYVYLYEPERRAPRAAQVAAAPGDRFPLARAAMLGVVTLAIAVVYFVQPINFSLVLKDLGVEDPKAIGLISAVPSLGVPVGSILYKLISRRGPTLQIGLALTLYCVGLGGIGLADSYQQALGFAFLQQMGSGIVVPGLIAWAQTQFSFEHRGRGMGVWTSTFFIGQFISPAVVAGVRGAVHGLQPAFVVFSIVAFLGACLAVLQARRQPTGSVTAVGNA